MKAVGVWMRLFISLFLVFHLFGVLTAPNPTSYLFLTFGPVYKPYMNFLNLAHTWGFFAPEPVSWPMHIDYVVEMKNGETFNGRFPDQQDPYFFRDRYNRRMSLTRLMVSTDDNLRNMFVHYFCVEHAGAESIKLWRIVTTPPSLEMVRKGEKKITDPVDTRIEVLGSYFCPEKRS